MKQLATARARQPPESGPLRHQHTHQRRPATASHTGAGAVGRRVGRQGQGCGHGASLNASRAPYLCARLQCDRGQGFLAKKYVFILKSVWRLHAPLRLGLLEKSCADISQNTSKALPVHLHQGSRTCTQTNRRRQTNPPSSTRSRATR
jgi:hypothetical protein